jgi:hypothetical protein
MSTSFGDVDHFLKSAVFWVRVADALPTYIFINIFDKNIYKILTLAPGGDPILRLL